MTVRTRHVHGAGIPRRSVIIDLRLCWDGSARARLRCVYPGTARTAAQARVEKWVPVKEWPARRSVSPGERQPLFREYPGYKFPPQTPLSFHSGSSSWSCLNTPTHELCRLPTRLQWITTEAVDQLAQVSSTTSHSHALLGNRGRPPSLPRVGDLFVLKKAVITLTITCYRRIFFHSPGTSAPYCLKKLNSLFSHADHDQGIAAFPVRNRRARPAVIPE